MQTLKEAWRVVTDWLKPNLYQSKELIEFAQAVEYGGIEIIVIAGKIESIKAWRGTREKDFERTTK